MKQEFKPYLKNKIQVAWGRFLSPENRKSLPVQTVEHVGRTKKLGTYDYELLEIFADNSARYTKYDALTNNYVYLYYIQKGA